MSLENYAIGAKQAANDAGLKARPDAEVVRSSPLRKGIITVDNGLTCTVQLLDDMGQVIKDADDNPIELTRVPKWPPSEDESLCLLWVDGQVIYIVNASGGGGACGQGLNDFGVLID